MAAESLRSAPAVQAALVHVAKIGTWIGKIPALRWRQLLMILVALWLCNSLARMFWVLVPVPQASVVPVIPLSSMPVKEQAGDDINLALINDLFGRYDPKAEEDRLARIAAEQKAIQAEEAVVETKLNLKLQGVIESSDAAKSWAIIGEITSQALYKTGDVIPGVQGVKIRSIGSLWVILDNNGKTEKLGLYDENESKVSAAAVNYPPPVDVSPQPQEDIITAEVAESDVKDIKSIGDVVRFAVATENGQMVGYKVRPGRKRELFDQVGLKNDDIVVSVNGIEVNEPQKVREVYQALKTATEANLEVMRDGSTQFIQIRMSSG